jgi:CBS domain-containing protein
MEIRELYRPQIVEAADDEPLIEAVSRMQFEEVGSLAVREHGRLVGILTERDVARALADGVDPVETVVGEYMTRDPITVTPGTDAADAAVTMLELGVRHLPVTEAGTVVGMLSSRDLLSLEAWDAVGVR